MPTSFGDLAAGVALVDGGDTFDALRLKLRWSMRTPSGSMRLHCLAQSARSRSRNSVESKGLFDTSTRFQTLRFLAPVFCSPGGGVYDRYPLAVLVI